MKRKRIVTVAVAALGMGLPSAAMAGSAQDDAFQTRMFGRVLGKDNGHACFRRLYDAGHLASHPKQNVRTMLLLVTGRNDPDRVSYDLSLGVTFRKASAHIETGGSCGSLADATGAAQNEVHCGVDCDGGDINVTLKDSGSVLVAIPSGAGVGVDAGEPASASRDRFGADDALFRLDKAALTDCLKLAADDTDKAAMRLGR